MESDGDERWVMVRRRGLQDHVVRRSEAIASIRFTHGGMYRWELLADRRMSGLAASAARAADEARAAWRSRRA